MKLRGLYAITPEGGASGELLAKVGAALEGGISLLQYRRKKGNAAEARDVVKLARSHGVPVIINDDVRLALEVGADGVHLGRDDGDLGLARRQLAGKILGVSCYDQLALARIARQHGADYVAFGSVFSSPTKPSAVRGVTPKRMSSLPSWLTSPGMLALKVAFDWNVSVRMIGAPSVPLR